ncbi:MAG: aldehyde dehydrogenase family protein [Actinophytocola sp.]|nr:aldehyde dehydrogenase family protein [Actinophytocola sp.]
MANADVNPADHQWRLLIGGELRDPRTGRCYETQNPSTEELLAEVPDAGTADVDAAVNAASVAQESWRRLAVRDRARAVRAVADVLADNLEEFARLDAADSGCPISAMRNDVQWAIDLIELFCDWAIELKGQTVPASAENLHYTVLEPYGVVARIVPFNHPIFFAAGKIAAPLIAGNTVVLKAPDQTPLSALRLGELLREVLPAGVVNVISGVGGVAGAALVSHPRVRRIAFIGSEQTGRRIQQTAAEAGVKHVTLELGGKNAMIVRPDADPDEVAAGAVQGMNFIGSQGQSCGSTSRLLVHESLEGPVLERIRAAVEDIRLGDPLDPETQMGPLVSRPQYERVLAYIEAARADGATVLTGGGPVARFSRGWYVEPTVLTNVSPAAPIAREEVFGPVLTVLPWREEKEAIELANSVDYGLTASIWTNDLRAAHRLAREVEAGYVWLNGSSRHFWGMPFGGMKASGVGREEDLEELRSFTQVKSVHVLL